MKHPIKRVLTATLLTATLLLSACQGGTSSSTNADGSFSPSRQVEFLVSSSAGGSSDIFARTISDIASTEGLVSQPFIVNNMPDGNGMISRMQVSTSSEPDHTLLCFSSGDMSAMLDNSDMTLEDFTPIAVLAADKHLVFSGTGGKYQSMEALLEGLENGDKIVVGGTKSDELTAYNMFINEIGYPDSFSYITYESSSESVTAILGEHVDLCMGKPASGVAYVESGDIIPVVAFASERFSAPFDTAPTMEDAGFNLVEFPVWRGVIGPKNMSEEALAFWNETFKSVTETDKWDEDYLSKFLLTANYQDIETTKQIMEKSQEDILANQ